MNTRMDDQIIETPKEENNPTSDATLLFSIEEMIKTHLSQIEELKEKITKHKEMLEDIFANDSTFQEHDRLAKEAAKVRSGTRQQIMKTPIAMDLSKKLSDFKTEKSELQDGLSDYLKEYQRLSRSNEIEGDDGEVREIIYTAKLIKKSSKFRP